MKHNQHNRTRSMTRRLSMLVMSMLVAVFAFAQTKTVTGVVTDTEGEPVIGASVTVPGTQIGVTTDIDGHFSLPGVPDKGKISISYVGCKSVVLPVAGKTHFEVQLQDDANMLDEVVAIGYATMKRSDLTGATSSVGAKDLVAVPATTAAQALQGKAAGVNIVTSSGAPGADMEITVRGGMSITQSTKPLYIVDGFEMSDALSQINVNDIETIDVLKDASATAIYGARGANGIILITTKSGQKGKTQVSYNGYVSFDHVSDKVDVVQNPLDYAWYQYEFGVLQGLESNYARLLDNDYAVDSPDFYSGAYGRLSGLYGNSYAIDWQDEMFGKNGFTNSQNVSVSTGNDKTQVMVSYNYTYQDGSLAKHDYKNNSFRTRINSELFKGIRLDINALYTNIDRHGGGGFGNMRDVLLYPINGGTAYTQDQMLESQVPSIAMSGWNTFFNLSNQIIANEAATSRRTLNIYRANGGLDIDFLKHFTWRTAGSYSYVDRKDTSFNDQRSKNFLLGNKSGMTGSIGYNQSTNWQITNTLHYVQKFGINQVDALIGQEITHSESTSTSLELEQFPDPNFGLDDISKAVMTSQSTGHSHSGISSFFGRVNYNYDDRYLLTATIRTDGSTKFARGHRWGVFPSAAGAWRVSQEKFFQQSDIRNWLNNLKLRIGYGVTGNCNIDSYMYNTIISTTTYPINNDPNHIAYVTSSTLGNPDLKWETLHATNIGLDLGFFNNRLNITAEWYNNQVNDLLMLCTIPSSTGYTQQYQNVGKMRNRGWEFTINSVNVQTRDFQWTSALNLSLNRSKVIALEDGIDYKTFAVGSGVNGQVRYYASVGERLGDMWGYRYEGVYTIDDFVVENGQFATDAVGNLILKDGVVAPFKENGDPIAVQPGDTKFGANFTTEDGQKQFRTGNYERIGNGTPKLFGGFTNNFTYKGFDASIFLKFCVGNDIYNATRASLAPYAQFANVTTDVHDNYYRLVDPNTGVKTLDPARLAQLNPNESTRQASLTQYNTNFITYPSSKYVEDGSYLRLATVTVGYTLPGNITRKAHINRLRIYFTGNNLATWTNYKGFDPEVRSSGNVVCCPGYDSSTYPRSRSYVIGANITF